MATIATVETEEHTWLQAASPSPDLYQYQSLPPKGWIRVLELSPGSGPLTCRLTHLEIEDPGQPYEALSYVWGNDSLGSVEEIICDGRILLIGSNLASALMHLRHPTRTRAVWADAVCINQHDVEEKSLQVIQMGNIYAGAERVVVWLGPDTNGESQECFNLIESATKFLDDLIERHQGIDHVPPIEPADSPLGTEPSNWEAAGKLMMAEYFSRTWVLQETGLARAALLQWGQCSMNWAHLVEFMLLVALRPDIRVHTGILNSGIIWDVFEDLWRTFGNADTWRTELPYCRSMNQTENKPSLINIINCGRYFGATDPRDHVFAFLSHPSANVADEEGEVKLLVPDYGASVDQVYLDTAVRILETDPHPWTVLSCLDHSLNTLSLSGMRPSWVPRWDEGWRTYWLGYPEMWYRAGGSDEAAFTTAFSSVDASLSLKGIVVDTIRWISRPYLTEEITLANQKAENPIQKLWEEVRQLGHSAVYGADANAGEYAFSLTAVAGRAADESAAEDDAKHHGAVYEAYVATVSGAEQDVAVELKHEAFTMAENHRRALHNRRCFRTQSGYYGVSHRTLEVGDVCCVFRGANVPFVLRPTSEGESPHRQGCFRIVGEAYVQGIMRGEVLDKVCSGAVVEREVILV